MSELTPTPGDIVHVRQRRYLVQEIEKSDNSSLTLVSMNCIEEDSQGEELSVLWEKEIDRKIEKDHGWSDVGKKGFDPRELFAAYFHILRWNCITATDSSLFQAPFRAGIKIEAFQLEPLAKALQMPRVNLFIADDVGLGKTIEAGLILSELLIRKKVKDVVVACPPSMTYQWKDELLQRFGFEFKIIDREFILNLRQERGYGVNPWMTHNKFIISHKLLIDESYTKDLRAWLGNLRKGSMLILDEAHHAAPSSGASYAVDSNFTQAIRELSHSFEHRLFLSATPHNGHPNSFAALLNILDPQRFYRGPQGEFDKGLLDQVMVRRLKSDIREIQGGFPERIVEKIEIENLKEDSAELVLSELLSEYIELLSSEFNTDKKAKGRYGLLLINLQKRLLSSIPAFLRTLKVHKNSLSKKVERGPVEVLGTSDDDILNSATDSDSVYADLGEGEMSSIEDKVIEDISSLPLLDLSFKNGQQLLVEKMHGIATKNAGYKDSKISYIIKWIKENLISGDKWNDRRLIIFTEWEDTLRYIQDQLSNEFSDNNELIRVFKGTTSKDDREEIKRLFNLSPKESGVRILIASDAAREGLNLQAYCHDLFHYDIPWNPARLEQRNGRIDRKLQPSPKVYCRYFVYSQRPEDRVLQVLIEKTERIKKTLGSLSAVITDSYEQSLNSGITRSNADDLKRMISDDSDLQKMQKRLRPIDSIREQAKLRDRILKLEASVQSSKTEIALNTENLKSAINMGLHLIDAGSLLKVNHPKGYETYSFPEIQNQSGRDDSWIVTMDSLRPAIKKDQKVDTWRKEEKIRPVVFESPNVMDESVVHIHIEHKLAKRVLSRFSSQGFKYNELSRTCFLQNTDNVKRVILLGKLCVFGKDASRLHEEIIAVASKWVEPGKRGSGGLKTYEEKTEKKTIELLEESLVQALGKKEMSLADSYFVDVSKYIETDIAEMKPLLFEKGNDLFQIAKKKLKDRADKEAEALRQILLGQRERILEHLEKVEGLENNQQGTLFDFMNEPLSFQGLNSEEKRQLKREIAAMKERLVQIDSELDEEPARVREVYEVSSEPRIEPVGLIYLMPENK